MDSRVERIRKVLDWLKAEGIFRSNREVAEKMGYNPSMLSQVITGKSAVSQRFVRSLCAVAPGLMYEWVWNGTGDMVRKPLGHGALPDETATDLERVTFIMAEMAQLMKSFSILAGPLDSKVKSLENTIREQDRKIRLLEKELRQIKEAATS